MTSTTQKRAQSRRKSSPPPTPVSNLTLGEIRKLVNEHRSRSVETRHAMLELIADLSVTCRSVAKRENEDGYDLQFFERNNFCRAFMSLLVVSEMLGLDIDREMQAALASRREVER